MRFDMMKNVKNLLKMSSKRQKKFIPSLLGLLCLLAFYSANISKPQVIEQLGNLLFDRYQIWKPREYLPEVPVRIIDIDNESLEKIGQWPWPRTVIAELNDRLTNAGAAVIGYDIVFSEPDRTSPENMIGVLQNNPTAKGGLDDLKRLTPHDQILSEAFSRSNVVAGFFLVGEETDSAPTKSTGFTYSWDVKIEENGRVKEVDNVVNFNGAFAALPILGNFASGEGFVSFNPTGDGIIRRAPMVYKYDGKLYPSLSAEVIRTVQGAGAFQLKSSDGSGEVGAEDSERYLASMATGDFNWPISKNGGFYVYFTKPSPDLHKSRFISAATILDPSIPMQDWADRVAGNVVFIGTSAPGLKDVITTPMRGGEPGVLAHAQIAEQILGEGLVGGQILKRPYWIEVWELLTLLIPGVFLVFALPRMNAAWGAVFSTTLAIAIVGFSWFSFSKNLLLINPIYPLLTIFTTYGLMTIVSFYMTETERSRIKSAFSMYLSPEMVKQVSDDPNLLKLGGEEKYITILFLDIRSFSKISEALEPQEITTFLNIFLTPMTDSLQESKATIDKYIGDAIVAFWNAPLDDEAHEKNAVRAVLKMNARLEELNIKYKIQDDVKWPDDVAMGIGINSGICCVGNLGSEQRFSYSMIGDAANLASRIEGLTKQYRVSTLIGNATAQAVSDFAIIEADLIKVIGRETTERIWILAGDESLSTTSEFETLRSLHQTFLTAFRIQEWDEAAMQIPELKTLSKPYGFKGYYDVMMNRIEAYRLSPPDPDWDGVHVATAK